MPGSGSWRGGSLTGPSPRRNRRSCAPSWKKGTARAGRRNSRRCVSLTLCAMTSSIRTIPSCGGRACALRTCRTAHTGRTTRRPTPSRWTTPCGPLRRTRWYTRSSTPSRTRRGLPAGAARNTGERRERPPSGLNTVEEFRKHGRDCGRLKTASVKSGRTTPST